MVNNLVIIQFDPKLVDVITVLKHNKDLIKKISVLLNLILLCTITDLSDQDRIEVSKTVFSYTIIIHNMSNIYE